MCSFSPGWSIVPEPLEDHCCECCGERFPLAGGLISDEREEDLAEYAASFVPALEWSQPFVHLTVLYVDPKGRPMQDIIAAVEVRRERGVTKTTAVTSRAKHLGRALTRKQL